MNNLELSADQVIDLIFEKKISLNDTNISVKHSFLSVLSKLEERIYRSNNFDTSGLTMIVEDGIKKSSRNGKKLSRI
jgi:hypothetical protein